MIRSKINKTREYDGVPLLEYSGPNPGNYEIILEKIKDRMDYMFYRHSQVLIVRLVVRFPDALTANEDNACFQSFIEGYRRALNHAGYDPHYVWVREQCRSRNHHYHLILLLDANNIRYFKSTDQAGRYWSKALSNHYGVSVYGAPLIEVCQTRIGEVSSGNGIVIHRDDQDSRQKVFTTCSYIAKVNTKGHAPRGVREFNSSYLP